MNRSTLARRYAPLVALAAIQLLIIATVPSKAPRASNVAAGRYSTTGGSEVPVAGSAGGTADGTAARASNVAGGASAATGGGGTGYTSGGGGTAAG